MSRSRTRSSTSAHVRGAQWFRSKTESMITPSTNQHHTPVSKSSCNGSSRVHSTKQNCSQEVSFWRCGVSFRSISREFPRRACQMRHLFRFGTSPPFDSIRRQSKNDCDQKPQTPRGRPRLRQCSPCAPQPMCSTRYSVPDARSAEKELRCSSIVGCQMCINWLVRVPTR